MRREWEPEDLIASWTLIKPDWELIGNKPGATRLGFAALLKFFEIDGRFPEYGAEVPDQAVTYLAEQVKVDPALFAKYQWAGRTSERHRAQVRTALGFRECTEADQRELAVWLAREMCPTELRREQLRDAVLAHCRSEQVRLEPPTFGQIHEGLQVVENWNSGNTDLHYGKGGNLTGPDREHTEVSMLALHLLQAALVHVNTALVERVLSEPDWATRMTTADRRALTPLFWTHINLYGKFDLDMSTRLDITGARPTAPVPAGL